jgi:hypothetical protein
MGEKYGNDLADLLFSDKDNVTVTEGKEKITLPGLGLNIARYNAGGSSEVADEKGEKMSKSKNMRAGGEVMGFWVNGASADPTSKSWVWSNDANQVSMLQKAHNSAGPDFIAELFSNSPMWWMLGNHDPSGSANGKKDNLKSQSYEQHAVYLATVAAHAKSAWNGEISSAYLSVVLTRCMLCCVQSLSAQWTPSTSPPATGGLLQAHRRDAISTQRRRRQWRRYCGRHWTSKA